MPHIPPCVAAVPSPVRLHLNALFGHKVKTTNLATTENTSKYVVSSPKRVHKLAHLTRLPFFLGGASFGTLGGLYLVPSLLFSFFLRSSLLFHSSFFLLSCSILPSSLPRSSLASFFFLVSFSFLSCLVLFLLHSASLPRSFFVLLSCFILLPCLALPFFFASFFSLGSFLLDFRVIFFLHSALLPSSQIFLRRHRGLREVKDFYLVSIFLVFASSLLSFPALSFVRHFFFFYLSCKAGEVSSISCYITSII